MSLDQEERLVKALEGINDKLRHVWNALDLLVMEFRKRELAYENIVQNLAGHEGTD